MQNGAAEAAGEAPDAPQSNIHDGLVTVRLSKLADLARCPICMGVLKETRTISVCMHRFCRTCIEAWLRSNIDNTCPQCRESFASRRNCKPDPTFDDLLRVIFGADTDAADDALLETDAAVLASAKAVGAELAAAREVQRAAAARAAMAAGGARAAANRAAALAAAAASAEGPSASDEFSDGSDGSSFGRKRPAGSAAAGGGPAKRGRGRGRGGGIPRAPSGRSISTAAPSPDLERFSPSDAPGVPSALFYGVREHGGRWMAYSHDGSRPTSAGATPMFSMIGYFSSEEDAARIVDLHLLRTRGPKTNRMNFPHLIPVFQRLLSNGIAPGASPAEYAVAAARVASAAQGVAPPAGWVPPLQAAAASKKKQGPRPGSSAAAGGGGGSRPGSSKAGTPRDVLALAAEAEAAAAVEDRATLRARELAAAQPSTALEIPAGGRVGVALVDVRPGDGVSEDLRWTMTSLMCKPSATVDDLAALIAAGLNEQRQRSNRNGTGGDAAAPVPNPSTSVKALSAASIQLNVTNELDGGADFMAVYESVGAAGAIALRRHLGVRQLLLLLADCGEDLALEYTVEESVVGDKEEKKEELAVAAVAEGAAVEGEVEVKAE